MIRLRDKILNSPENKLEALRDSFSISDIDMHIKGLMIELIDYRLQKHLHREASLIEFCELNMGELE